MLNSWKSNRFFTLRPFGADVMADGIQEYHSIDGL